MDKEKDRSLIAGSDKWDLSKMYKDLNAFDSDIELLKEYHKRIMEFKGKIMDSSSNLESFYKAYIAYDNVASNLYTYAHMLCDENTKNQDSQAQKMKVDKLIDDLGTELSFITPEILSVNFEDVEKFINENKNLEKYRFDLERMFRYKSHTLSDLEEELISKASIAMGTGDEVFYNLDNSDIHLDKIRDENGTLVELNNSNYIKYMSSKDRSVRKSAFLSMYHYWESIKNTVAATYKGQIKEDFFESSVHKYQNPLTESLYSDNIDVAVYHNLIDTVHKNLDKMYDYVHFRKEFLGLDELHMYDVYVDLCEEKPKDIPFEEGKKIVFEALKPLGDEYLSDLEKAFSEHWIDIYPNDGKKSGAYSWGTYDSVPYVLLNYNNTIDSVSTMAHELGHSMHSYYSKSQDYLYHNYPIFLAEIASTVNEILLNDYLCKHAKTKDEKRLYLNEFLDKIKGTLYRQTMFAEFEMLIHDKYEKGIPLTEEEISSTYYNLNKLYFGDEMVSDDLIRFEWMRIPHFYTPFYVYKYATGISAAISFASDILNNSPGAKEKYLKFLHSGSSDYPLNILTSSGVDMTKREPIEKALDMFSTKLKELKELV